MTTQAPSAQIVRLDNGVVLASACLPHVSRSHVVATLRGGPVIEDDETWGLSHVLEHMVFRGARGRPNAHAVSLAADRFGGEIGGATYRDRVVFDTRVDPGREGEAMALLADMLIAPRFEGFHVEKDVLREELVELLDENGQEIDPDNLALRRLFDGHVLARSIEGTLHHVERVDEALLRAFHRSAYQPEHLVVCVVGPGSPSSSQAWAPRTFGRMRGEGPVLHGRAPRRLPSQRRVDVVRTEASQTSVRICFPCTGLTGPERHVLSVLTRILDDGPASRFQSNLIDGAGLAYALWCGVDFFAERGVLEVGAQVQHDRVGPVVEAVCQELDALRRRPPHSSELARIRARLRRDLRDLRDDPAQLADSIGRGILLGVPFSPWRIEEEYARVTPAQVTAAARHVLRGSDAVLTLVGRPPRRAVQQADSALRALI